MKEANVNEDIKDIRIDRSVFSVAKSFEEAELEDIRYALSLTVEERLAALQIQQRIAFNYGDPPPRMERVWEFVKLKDLKE